MGTYMKPIGGEFWHEENIYGSNRQNFENIKGVFLSGGQSALRYIFKNISLEKNQYVLMPSYLCPTMLYPLEQIGVSYEFYKINADLSIDLENIEKKLKTIEVKAVFFINYFGFYHNKKTREFLLALKKRNITIIEDCVQMLYFKRKEFFIGDYIFNSYRKFFPIDGSLVLNNNNDEFELVEDNRAFNEEYKNIIKEAREKKTLYIKKSLGEEEEFLNLFHKAEEKYYNTENIEPMDIDFKKLLNNINEDLVKQVRYENYKYLYENLKILEDIKIMFDLHRLENTVPIGFPILIKDRDALRTKLREEHIYCPVHWNILKEKWSEAFKESRYVSSNILTLPIDQRYETKDMKRIISTISDF